MKEKMQSVGILKNRKTVILDVPYEKENLFVGTTDSGVPVYLVNSDNQLLPEYTGLAGQIFIYMYSNNEITYAEEICYKDGFNELMKDKGCKIEEFFVTGDCFNEQEWRFAKVVS